MPLVAIQLLWLNVVTDGIQDFALSFEKAEKGILKELILEMEHYASTNNVPIIELDSIKFIMKYIKLNNVV